MSVILGYSGLDGAQQLKLRGFPGLDERQRRLFQGLDSAAALIVDDTLVAAVQQERFSGIKFDHAFPVDAIDYCLATAGIGIADVDVVAHNFDYAKMRVFAAGEPYAQARYKQVYAPERQTALLRRHYPRAGVAVTAVDHHKAHALTAAIPSGFDEALVVVADGMGELNAITIYEWRKGVLRRLAALDYRASLGLFYALITMYLGFLPNSDEYKVMALAASGDPRRFRSVMLEAVKLTPDGGLTAPLLTANATPYERETFAGSSAWLTGRGCTGRDGDELRQVHLDLAAAAQCRLEEALFHLVDHWSTRTGLRKVALAGGVALNCVAIGKLATRLDAIYVQPAAGDEGTAIGSALAFGPVENYPTLTFLGPQIGPPPSAHPYWSGHVDPRTAELAAARLVAAGCIVGWAQGRLEFGPRALGNRSILADPRDRATRDRVNAAVKFREGFRPLAPAVKAEAADDYFAIPPGANTRHMTVAVPVRAPRQAEIPAVVHDDGTARIQTVHSGEHPRFWRILDYFHRLTGVPVLINTSLNVKGQPTARDASEAFRTFASSHLDVLFVGDTVFAKPDWTAKTTAAITGSYAAE